MTYIMVMLPLLKLTLNAVCMLKGCIYFEHKAQQGSEQIIDFLGNVEVMSSCNHSNFPAEATSNKGRMKQCFIYLKNG